MKAKHVAVVLGVFLVLSAMPAASQEVPQAPALISRLLQMRAAAVNEGDRGAFERTISPEVESFRASQMEWFDRFQELPLTDYALRHELEEFGEVTRQADIDEWGPGTVVATVEEKFRFEGFEVTPDINSLYLTFVRRGSDYVIADDTALDDLGLLTERQPWEAGDVRTKSSEHFLMVFHPQDEALAESTLEQAERAIDQVSEVWQGDWSEKVVAYVPSTIEELEDLLGVTFDVSNFVAFAHSAFDIDEFRFTGTRIIVNKENFVRHSLAARRGILTHELLHVATRDASGILVPSWVEEGLAQLTGTTSISDVHASVARVFDGDVATDMEFLTGTSTDISNAYATALSAIGYMRETYGIDGVNRFYEEIGGVGVEPGTVDYHVDQASRTVLGKPFDEFEAEWAAEVRGG